MTVADHYLQQALNQGKNHIAMDFSFHGDPILFHGDPMEISWRCAFRFFEKPI